MPIFTTNSSWILKKVFKILRNSFLVLLGLLILIFILINIPAVQNYLVDEVASILSKDLQTTVKVKRVNLNLAFFNRVSLEGTMVKDRRNDTLLYAGKLKVKLSDYFFFRDTMRLKFVGLEDAVVNLHRVDSIWNYAFLADYFSSPSTGKKKKAVNLDLKNVELRNIHFLMKDEWRGEDMTFNMRSLDLDARQLDLPGKTIRINDLAISEPYFFMYNYPGRRPKRPRVELDPDLLPVDSSLKWNAEGWNITLGNMAVTNGTLRTGKQSARKPFDYFDASNILFTNINSTLKNVRVAKDTVSGRFYLSSKERSGFEIKSINADVKIHPQGMQFFNLDIITNKSRLRDYFAMSYHEFDDMSDFIEKVRLDGNFKNSEIESDDIAFFAPQVKDWKKHITIIGSVTGTVSDLSTKNITIKAGKNTVLNGDIKMVGLPDIEKTIIDFKANDFHTNYQDAVSMIPVLKTIDVPRLDRINYLQYKGFFTGFIYDFIATGVIKTNLGTLTTDITMKMDPGGASTYSGKINTNSFAIGKLVDHSPLGNIAFNGSVKGNGFKFTALQATLIGNIRSIDYNNYRYSNIKVNGTIAKRLFNGEIVASDSNLTATLNGLIDFREAQPRFDLSAEIAKANLKKLNLYKDNIDINGNINLNFSGSDIDNFLGSAKILNAAIYNDGRKIAFDSLIVESGLSNGSKTIRVASNELDAMLVGDFSIKELPNAFQTFLYNYYPSYIKPSRKTTRNENFTFFVTTRKIDDYIALIDKNLKGFNNSNFSGRINLQQNVFHVDAEVPQFNYKNVAFENVKLQGRGNLDTLTLNTIIGDVLVNDSLHFPATAINIQSSHNLSQVNIVTSASQALNAANISGQVLTSEKGVRIVFNPSTFDINGKKWTIDKNGELSLSNELVTSEGLRIYNEDQEVYITSQPSSIGNTNDLQIALKKINIGDFVPFFTKDFRIEGRLNGTVNVADLFGNVHVSVNADAEQFRLDDDSLGSIKITTDYTKNTGKVIARVISANELYNFDADAIFNTRDSTGQELDLNFNLRNTSIHLLEKYLDGIFSRLSGLATGRLQVIGPAKNLKYLGDITLTNGGLMVDYTKCYYKIPNAHVLLQDGSIDFGSFTIRDTLNNTATLENGRLLHEGFKNLDFDFHLKSNRLLLLNTVASDNNQFYGTMIGRVDMGFTGPLEDMQMSIKGAPTDSSNIYLPISSSRESGTAGFIVWKVYGREMEAKDFKLRESNLTVSLDLTANRFANVYVILDDLTGDIIKAQGTGNLKIRAGTKEEMTMSGRYNIDRGDYTFTFQSLKRKFKLKEEAGSYISWNGDPAQATIDIEAEYIAENVRFSDLLNGSSLAGAANEDVKRFRGKVLVIATLTEQLTKPSIAFRIELPQNSPIRTSPDVATIFSFIENDVNELNKQVSFLILFNTFGPYTGGGARAGGTGDLANKALEGIVVNSISGFLSNILTKEFSNVLQNIFKDKSLKVNISASLYSGSNLIDNYNPNQVSLPDRTNFNLSIGKSFFNERLNFIVGGAVDFGLNTTQQNQTAAFPFLPDVTAEWLLTPDGKFRLTFFYRENYSYLTTNGGGKQNRSGTSISFRKEFDTFDQIFRKRRVRRVRDTL